MRLLLHVNDQFLIKEIIQDELTIAADFIHTGFPRVAGHLWLSSVLFDEKNRPHSSHTHSHTFPCCVTSCRSLSCRLENCSKHPIVHRWGDRGLALCASVWTFRVYWFVNLRLQLGFRQRKRRCFVVSCSLGLGEKSQLFSEIMSDIVICGVIGESEDDLGVRVSKAIFGMLLGSGCLSLSPVVSEGVSFQGKSKENGNSNGLPTLDIEGV